MVVDLPEGVCPAFVSVPAGRAGSRVGAVVDVARRVGRVLDGAQVHAVDVLSSCTVEGFPAVLVSGVVCPRQNLKTFVLECMVLERLLAPDGVRLVVWSAHEVATAQETFQHFRELIEQFSWLADRVVRVSSSPGREEIHFRDPLGRRGMVRRLRFRARVKTGGRGLAGDVVVLDEAFALTAAQLGSLVPILSTRPAAQVLFGSSAPLANSRVLREWVAKGRDGVYGYVEYSVDFSWRDPGCVGGFDCLHFPGALGCVLDDEDRWREANPALVSGRIGLSYVRQERGVLPPDEFARERLGVGDEPAGSVDPPFTSGQWASLVDEGVEVPESLAVSLFVGRDRDVWAVGVAGWVGERVFVDVAACGVGGGDVGARELVGVLGRVGGVLSISRGSDVRPAVVGDKWSLSAVGGVLDAAGVVPWVWSWEDFGAAGAGLQDGVRGGLVVHRGRSEVSDGLAGARVRWSQAGWLWDLKKSGSDVCALVAVTMAHRALIVADRPVGDWAATFG